MSQDSEGCHKIMIEAHKYESPCEIICQVRELQDKTTTYPSLRRIMRSSLERLRSVSHRRKLGDNSLLLFVTSITVVGLTNGETFAP